MDILNDYYPLNGNNPKNDDLSDSEISENNEHILRLQTLNENRLNKKRRKEYSIDEWCSIHSDDLWYMWGIISEFKKTSYILDKMDYTSFCDMCYQNSSKDS